MIFTEMFASQKELDNKIDYEHNLKNEDVFDKKVVALIVEVCELANETRFFKFWSYKKPSPKEKILDEYSDCIHFLLSLGNDLSTLYNIEVQLHDYQKKIDYSGFTSQFLALINYICKMNQKNEFKKVETVDYYYQAFEMLLAIGHELGFSKKDIEYGYYKKHQRNIERQETGY